MALSADQETAEHAMRIEQMQSTIEHSRLNMQKLESDMRWENRKFFVSLLVGVAAVAGAGVALGNYIGAQQGRQDAMAATRAEDAIKAEAASIRSLIEALSKERQVQFVYVLPGQPLPGQPPALPSPAQTPTP